MAFKLKRDDVSVLENGENSGNVLFNDSGADQVIGIQAGSGAYVTITAEGSTLQGLFGFLTIMPNGSYVYTAELADRLRQGATSTDSFTYYAAGGGLSGSTTLKFSVTGVNDAPVLLSTVVALPTITEDKTSNSGVKISSFLQSTDADSSLRGIAITGLNSGNGKWQYSTDARATWQDVGPVSESSALLLAGVDFIRFVPNGLNGTTADFTYRAWDQTSGVKGAKVDASTNGGETAFSAETGNASILVTEINDAPIAVASSASGTQNGPPITGQLQATDPEGSPLTYALVSKTAVGGSVSINSATGAYSFTPNANFVGIASFQFTASDGSLTSAKITITITIAEANNNPPVAVADSASTTESTPVLIDVLANDTDADGNVLAITSIGSATNGTVELVNGQVQYAPNAGFVGSDTFTYSISDGAGGTAEASVAVTVTATEANNPPVAVADSASTTESTPVLIDVLANDTDADGNVLAITSIGSATNGTVELVNGQVQYAPNAGFVGSDTFTYSISDGAGGTAEASVAVTVQAANTAPAVVSVSFRQGANGYYGVVDTQLVQNKPSVSFDDAVTLRPTTDSGKAVDALLRFDGLFGTGPGQIPVGAQIVSATLQVEVTGDSTAGGTINRMLVGWSGSSTWNSLGSGVQLNNIEATSSGVTVGAVAIGSRAFDVTDSLVAWNGASSTYDGKNQANRGWVFKPTNTDPWDFTSSQGAVQPVLNVTYTLSSTAPSSLPAVSISAAAAATENSGKLTFNVSLSQPAPQDVTVHLSTRDHTAKAGSDYVETALSLTFLAGETTKSFDVNLVNDSVGERLEAFTVQIDAATNATINATVATGKIIDDDVTAPPMPALTPSVIATYDISDGTKYKDGGTGAYGISDPSGIAYIPDLGILLVADSEHDESPFYSNTNMFSLGLDGSYIRNYSLTSFTKEPTGLAYNSSNGYLYIADDDKAAVSWVSLTNPTVRLGFFETGRLGFLDTEDFKFDPLTGNLHIVDGSLKQMFELTSEGAFVDSVSLPTVMRDAEALAFDPLHDLYFVAAATSKAIWIIDAEGAIKGSIDVFSKDPNIKGLELAPSSNPNDGDLLSLYVAGYGADQVNDGKLFEIYLGSGWVA